MADIVAKDLSYSFSQDENVIELAKSYAVDKVKALYNDEHNFVTEEYASMYADGDVSSEDEYREAMGIEETDVDYMKSFEENINHPIIQNKIENLTQTYLGNYYDLPKNAVVQIDDSFVGDKGVPQKAAVIEALNEMFKDKGVSVSNYAVAGEASKTDKIAQQAFENIGEMMKSSDYNTYLNLRASIGKYSSSNISLIYLQKPESKAVMGYQAWTKLDRHVQQGQTGLYIYMPNKLELKTEKDVDKYLERNFYDPYNGGKALKDQKASIMEEIEQKGVYEVISGFRLAPVFDISQTEPNDPEHDNIGQIINLNKPLNQDLSNFDEVIKSAKEAATHMPLIIKDSTSQQDAFYEALVEYADKTFASFPEKIQGIKSNIPLVGEMHQIESVMAAHMIAQHIGIDSNDKTALKLSATLDIIDKYSTSEETFTIGKRGMFMQSFDRACKLTDEFVKAFDKSFGIDLEAQRDAIRSATAEKQAQREAEKKAKAENRVYIGRTYTQKVDEWQKGDMRYIISQGEKDNLYYVKTFNGANDKGTPMKGEDGKPASFTKQPSREDVEIIIANMSGVSQDQDQTAPKKTVQKGR